MSIFSDLIERARSLLFRAREERELEEELRTHLEMEAEYRKRRGESDSNAYRSSAIALGGIERVKDDVRDARGTRPLHDIWRDIGFGARSLASNRGFTLVTLATLAIGIGGTTAVFSAVDAVLLQPLPYAEPGQLVRLFQHRDDRPDDRSVVSPVHFVEVRDRMSSFASIAALYLYSETGADIGVGDGVRRVRTLQTTVDYFDVVRVRPEIGRGFQPDEQIAAPVVILSHDLWKEQLNGDRDVVGRTMTMSGQSFTIIGVMPAGFRDPLAGAVDAWTPLDLRPAQKASNSGNHYLSVIARLRPATTIERAQAELNAVLRAIGEKYPDANRMRARLYSLKEDIIGNSNRALEIMFGAVVLVLILVCVNVANLMLVRGSDRAHEFAVRTALGAERWRLVRQMLVESLMLAFAGAVAGLGVARLAMSAMVALGADTIPRLSSLTLQPRLLAFSFVIATVSAVAFGLAPALRAARTQPGDALRDQSRSSTGGLANMRLREWLVVSQVALAFMLLVGAGLLISSLERIQRVELGITPSNVLTFALNLPDSRYDSTARAATYESVAKAMAALPGVRAAGGVSKLPATGHYNVWGVRATSGPLVETQQGRGPTENRVVSGEYFRAVGIPLLKGRAFDSRDVVGAQSVVMVSKSLADKLYPKLDPIGQTLTSGGRAGTIVGVVGEAALDIEGQPATYVYHPHAQFAGNRNWALMQTLSLAEADPSILRAVQAALASIDPLLVVHRPTMLDAAIGRGAAQRVFTLRVLMAFATIALVLAALGIFGVLSFGVRMRAREFSIRMALGAQRGSIRAMVLRRGLIVAAIGTAIGVAFAMALSRFMRSMLFEVSPLSPIVFVSAVVFMGLVAGVSAYLPAHRATSTDPRSALQ